MRLFYADETNLNSESGKFFIYGGVVIDANKAASVSNEIAILRSCLGYRDEDLLKFNTNETPDHISYDVHREAKKQVIEIARNHEVKLITSFILHDIAKNPDEARANEINRCCYHFNCYMNWITDKGLVFLDTFSSSGESLPQILRKKFSLGLEGMPYSDPYLKLDNILGFHENHIGTSHFSSLVDIVIGSLRYAVNESLSEGNLDTSRILLEQLAPMFIEDSSNQIHEISCFFSPKIIRKNNYLEIYSRLKEILADAGINCGQTLTNVRQY